MQCQYCGTVSDNCAFCPSCGAQLAYATGSNQQAPAGQTAQQAYTAPPVYQQPVYQQVVAQPVPVVYVSQKSRLAALLLAFFLGVFGIHRFYAGKVGTGIFWLLTWGCFGIGYIVDIIVIACGSFRDRYGLYISNW